MSYTPVILVTGSNTGIGYEVVRQLAEKGSKVYLSARDEAKGKEAVEKLKKEYNLDVPFVLIDITDSKSILAAKDFIEKQEGKLDVLVNNAAMAFMDLNQKASDPASLDAIRKATTVNLFGTIEVTQTFLPLIRKALSGHGHIVNITTDMASNSIMAGPPGDHYPPTTAYNTCKAALNSYTIALARELKAEKIKVNCVTPGFTSTQLNFFREGGRTPESAARSIIPLVLYGPGDDITGKFYSEDGTTELPW